MNQQASIFASPPETWSVEGETVRVPLECVGIYGTHWIQPLRVQQKEVFNSARLLLQSDDADAAKRAPAGKFNARILRASRLHGDGSLLERAHAVMRERSLRTPSVSLGGLLCEKFTSHEIRYHDMGFSRLIILHDPVQFGEGAQRIQVDVRDGKMCLSTCDADLQDCQPRKECWRDIGLVLLD